MSKKRLSRREFLKVSGVAAAGATWAAASFPTLASGASRKSFALQEEAEVVWMMNDNEFSDEEIEIFHEKNPGITLNRIDNDQTALFAMMAAGEPPDVWRLQFPQFPQLLARDLVLNLQTFFETSSDITFDDLVQPNDFYKAVDAFNIGEGDLYGMIKDWSPDMTMFVNDQLFEDAGVDPVPGDEPLSYQEWGEIAAQIKQFDGDRAEVVGMFMNISGWSDRYWEAWLQAMGQSLFSEDFQEAVIVDNDDAREMIQYHLDLAKDLTIVSPKLALNSWACPDFIARTLAIVQFGYWFSACTRINSTEDEEFQALMDAGKIRMVPAPTWGGERSSPTITATASVVSSATANPDASWAAFEYYMAQEPAITRAEVGWGVPALQSLFDLLPKDDTYGQINFEALMAEIDYGAVIQANPFLPGGEPGAVGQVFNLNLEEYIDGNVDFETILFEMEDETNFAIEEGMDRIG